MTTKSKVDEITRIDMLIGDLVFATDGDVDVIRANLKSAIRKELQDVARRAFEAGRSITIINGEDLNEDGWPESDYTYTTFEDYEKSDKEQKE